MNTATEDVRVKLRIKRLAKKRIERIKGIQKILEREKVEGASVAKSGYRLRR